MFRKAIGIAFGLKWGSFGCILREKLIYFFNIKVSEKTVWSAYTDNAGMDREIAGGPRRRRRNAERRISAVYFGTRRSGTAI